MYWVKIVNLLKKLEMLEWFQNFKRQITVFFSVAIYVMRTACETVLMLFSGQRTHALPLFQLSFDLHLVELHGIWCVFRPVCCCLLVALQEYSVPSSDKDSLTKSKAAVGTHRHDAVGLASSVCAGGAELAVAEVPYQHKRKRFASKKSSSFRERKLTKRCNMDRRSSACNEPTLVSDCTKSNSHYGECSGNE